MTPRGILKIQTQAESMFSSFVQAKNPFTKRQCNVSFGNTEILVYPQLLDTSCGGPALTIGWEPVDRIVTTVQEYHSDNLEHSNGSKIHSIKAEHRISMLLSAGYSREQLYHHMLTFSLRGSNESKQQHSKTIYHKLQTLALKLAPLKLTGVKARPHPLRPCNTKH
ncbi:expressed unknown protein [Seminavis robusta]|uniref:Uncharacterized protein n=1 Tax=Seminavis robusta TaxID=568900 RepID=A0A9N8HBK3_9STRA|nr:expressed unknown protein [Seminavis robusta]|eukprot:Sro342_g121760.1 n/a (166) ;mRNA; f:43262-43759